MDKLKAIDWRNVLIILLVGLIGYILGAISTYRLILY